MADSQAPWYERSEAEIEADDLLADELMPWAELERLLYGAPAE